MGKYTKAELSKKSVADLRELASDEDLEFDTDKPAKAEVIEALLDIEEQEVDDEEEDDEVDDDAEEADDEEDDEELDEADLEEDEVDDEPAKPAAKAKAPAKKKAAKEESGTLAAKQVATILGTEAKTLRQFFRSPASTVEAVGSGGRYEFNESDIDKIKSEFEAWKAGHAARGAKRDGTAAPKKRGRRGAAVEVVEADVEEVEELEIEELEEDAELELDDEVDDDEEED